MTESLDQILELIKKTGDRCVVIDRATQSNYVVMSIKDYEHLVLGDQKEATCCAQSVLCSTKEKKDSEPIKSSILEEEVEQNTASLDSAHTQEPTAQDWWSEKAEKPQALEDKPADDQYYLEPIES